MPLLAKMFPQRSKRPRSSTTAGRSEGRRALRILPRTLECPALQEVPSVDVAEVSSYSSLTFEEVVQELVKQKNVVKKKDAHIRELEDYIDNLLVRVMEETPNILRTPYEPKKKAGKFSKK